MSARPHTQSHLHFHFAVQLAFIAFTVVASVPKMSSHYKQMEQNQRRWQKANEDTTYFVLFFKSFSFLLNNFRPLNLKLITEIFQPVLRGQMLCMK